MPNQWKRPKLRLVPSKARLRSLFTRKRVLIAGSIFAAFIILTPMATYAYYARDISDRERLMNRNNTGVVLKDKNGEVFYESGKVNGDNAVPLSQISDNLENALIASEDQNFYEHGGYSIRGIARALYGNTLNRDATRYGGSTITQQLVKNNLLSSEKNYLRKFQEVSMAVAVEREYSKQDILEMYLNSVYYGEGAFGINDAARTYFGKSPADLTVAESALLVGLLPAPNTYSPINGDPELAAQQQKRVLEKMVEEKYISKDEQQQALAGELTYAGASASGSFEHAQHYALMVLDELYEQYGEERVTRSGFTVTTTLDLPAQKQAESVVQKRVATFASGGGRNASLVAINPKNGQVQALVGSVDWDNEEFGKVNMTLTPRQPGSSFKPIYFAEALDKRLITAATIVKDERRTFGDYRPENFDFKFRGNMTVRSALAESRNIPAIEVLEKVGPAAASRAAQRMGISTVTEPEKYGLTLALGTAETRLYDMTNAYAAFANGGQQFEPVLFTSVRDKYNNTVYDEAAQSSQTPTRVIGQNASFILSSILSDNAARAPTFGSSLNISGRQVALKTGTTDENKDAWTIGYTPDIAVGVWVGNNENQPMRGLAGGSSAGVIWRETMTSLTANAPQSRFTAPSGVSQLNVCRGTEQRASGSGTNTFSEYFISGSEPTRQCNVQRPVEENRQETREQAPTQNTENNQDAEAEDNSGNSNRGGGDEEEEADTPAVTPAPTTPTTPAPSPVTPPQPTPVGGRGSGGDSDNSSGGSGSSIDELDD